MQDNFVPFTLLPSITHLNLSTLGKPTTKVANIGSSNLTYIRGLNQPVDKFPESLRFLVLGFLFNSPLPILPPSLTHLSFGGSLFNLAGTFNYAIQNLPSSLTFLEFNDSFNDPVDFTSTPNLTHLIFGESFNQPVDGYLPNALTHLHFGEDFNLPLGHLPQHLTHLFLNGMSYRHTLRTLPYSLISFSTHHYSKPLLLPPNITHCRSKVEANFLYPSFITHLNTYILYLWPSPLSSRFPSLTHLILSVHITNVLRICSFPESLTHLQIRNYISAHFILPLLPPNLIFLKLIDTGCSEFPKSLQYLWIHHEAKKLPAYPLPPLPNSLTHLWTNKEPPGTIPGSVTHLSMEGAYLTAPLPPSITHLQIFLRHSFNADISAFLPHSLVFLALEGNQSYINNFTDSITTLCISSNNNNKLPKSVKFMNGCAMMLHLPGSYFHVQIAGVNHAQWDFPNMEELFIWSARYQKLHSGIVNF